MHSVCVCEVGTVGKISDCQPDGPEFNPRPGRTLNFGQPSFAIPSVHRKGCKAMHLVSQLSIRGT